MRHAVGHIGTEDDDLVGPAVDGAAQGVHQAAKGAGGRHPAQRHAGVGMKVHAPHDVARAAQALEDGADESDDRRRGQGDDDVKSRQAQRLEDGSGVETQVIGHAGPGAATTERGCRNAMDVDAFMGFEGGGPGLARFVAALGGEDVALESPLGQEFRQIGQVLGGRCVVGPVILVDEEDARGRRIALFGAGWSERMRNGDLGRVETDPARGQSRIDTRVSCRGCGSGFVQEDALAQPASFVHHFRPPGPRSRPSSLQDQSIRCVAAGGGRSADPLLEREGLACLSSPSFAREGDTIVQRPRSVNGSLCKGGGELMTRDDSRMALDYAGRAFCDDGSKVV